jgi:hypothetical protein
MAELASRAQPARTESGEPTIHVDGATLSFGRTIRIEVNGRGSADRITILMPLNNVGHVNRMLAAINDRLPVGGILVGFAETAEQRKRRLLADKPNLRARLNYFFDVLFRRVMPKLATTRNLYFRITNGTNRVFSRAEILGRLVFSGFDIAECSEGDGVLRFTARKTQAPSRAPGPDQGPLLRMDRIGRNGRTIRVFKIRTMHPYAEYLQAHIHEKNRLAANGKFGADYRVTTIGRVLRRYWIDEVPMVVNLIRGDLKLVGVRPLTPHYLSLYPQELAALRSRHKPGLIPPFYADLPQGFEAILASERHYLERYEQAPIRTDISYFWRSIVNIAIRGARSQ